MRGIEDLTTGEKFCSEANEYLRERNKTTKVIPVTKGSFEFIF